MNNKEIIEFSLPQELAEIEKAKCINIAKPYRVLVPLDGENAERLYRYDIYQDGEIRPEFVGIEFHENTYYYMETRLFSFINVECDVLINMYEEEVLFSDQFEKAIDTITRVMDNSDDAVLIDFSRKLLNCINTAKQFDTVVGFYF